jgi:hypothetical protein
LATACPELPDRAPMRELAGPEAFAKLCNAAEAPMKSNCEDPPVSGTKVVLPSAPELNPLLYPMLELKPLLNWPLPPMLDKLTFEAPGSKSAILGSREKKLPKLSIELNLFELIPVTPGNRPDREALLNESGNIVPADGKLLNKLLPESRCCNADPGYWIDVPLQYEPAADPDGCAADVAVEETASPVLGSP